MYKIETQDETGVWHDVRGPHNQILTFSTKTEARSRLETLYPVLVKMEKYGGPKRTRILAILAEERD